MYSKDSGLNITDLEYAYETGRKYSHPYIQILKQHHGKFLKPQITDWYDAFGCLVNFWRRSDHWFSQEILTRTAYYIQRLFGRIRSQRIKIGMITKKPLD